MSHPESQRKSKPIRCTVISDAMDKSRVAKVERLEKHPRYGKFMRKTTKLMFHDEKNETERGDQVLIESCRPYSARKKFILKQIVRKHGVIVD